MTKSEEKELRVSNLIIRLTTLISSRWLIVTFCGLIMFGNHYARDSLGALELQMETDLGITSEQFATINSIYFIPSIFAPVLAGIFTEKLGGSPMCFFYSVLCGGFGHYIFSLGIQFESISLVYTGRAIAGFMYDIIDCLPLNVLQPLFHSQFGLVVGLLNGFLRLGSVANFILSPIVYKNEGVKTALWVSTFFGSIIVIFAAAILYILNEINKKQNQIVWYNDTEKLVTVQLSDIDDSDASSNINENINDDSYEILCNENTTTTSTNNQIDLSFCQRFEKFLKNAKNTLVVNLPFHKFGWRFYMYLCTGACLYGGMAPLWIIGSKFLQDNYGLSVGKADILICLPEGAIALLSAPLGMMVDNCKYSTKTKMMFLAISCLLLPISYIALAKGFYFTSENGVNIIHTLISPSMSMVMVGLAYAISNCLFWSTVVDIIPGKYFAFGNGLISGSLNILPSIILPLLVIMARHFVYDSVTYRILPMYVLSFMGVLASTFALFAYLSPDVEIEKIEKNNVKEEMEEIISELNIINDTTIMEQN